MIFAPGFSTAEKVTNVSGRGVGMDVVKTNIEKIGGTIDVQSKLRARARPSRSRSPSRWRSSPPSWSGCAMSDSPSRR